MNLSKQSIQKKRNELLTLFPELQEEEFFIQQGNFSGLIKISLDLLENDQIPQNNNSNNNNFSKQKNGKKKPQIYQWKQNLNIKIFNLRDNDRYKLTIYPQMLYKNSENISLIWIKLLLSQSFKNIQKQNTLYKTSRNKNSQFLQTLTLSLDKLNFSDINPQNPFMLKINPQKRPKIQEKKVQFQEFDITQFEDSQEEEEEEEQDQILMEASNEQSEDNSDQYQPKLINDDLNDLKEEELDDIIMQSQIQQLPEEDEYQGDFSLPNQNFKEIETEIQQQDNFPSRKNFSKKKLKAESVLVPYQSKKQQQSYIKNSKKMLKQSTIQPQRQKSELKSQKKYSDHIEIDEEIQDSQHFNEQKDHTDINFKDTKGIQINIKGDMANGKNLDLMIQVPKIINSQNKNQGKQENLEISALSDQILDFIMSTNSNNYSDLIKELEDKLKPQNQPQDSIIPQEQIQQQPSYQNLLKQQSTSSTIQQQQQGNIPSSLQEKIDSQIQEIEKYFSFEDKSELKLSEQEEELYQHYTNQFLTQQKNKLKKQSVEDLEEQSEQYLKNFCYKDIFQEIYDKYQSEKEIYETLERQDQIDMFEGDLLESDQSDKEFDFQNSHKTENQLMKQFI